MISEERKQIIQHYLDGGEIQKRNKGYDWFDFDAISCNSPFIECDSEQWRIKPENVIDLSPLHSDCLMADGNGLLKIGKQIHEYSPLMSHWNTWLGGDCPIPDGFEYEILFRNGDNAKGLNAVVLNWEHDCSDFNIIAYRFLRKLDGWVYPWEIEE